jgi:hypothetical protein
LLGVLCVLGGESLYAVSSFSNAAANSSRYAESAEKIIAYFPESQRSISTQIPFFLGVLCVLGGESLYAVSSFSNAAANFSRYAESAEKIIAYFP